MFLLGLIGLLAIVYFILIFIKHVADKRGWGYASVVTETRYELNPERPDVELTDLQEKVLEYMLYHGSEEETTLKAKTKVSKTVLTNLVRRRVLNKDANYVNKQRKLWIFIATLVALTLAMVFANYYLLIKINLRYYGIIFYVFIYITLAYNMIDKFRDRESEKQLKNSTLIFLGFMVVSVFLGIFGGRTFMFAEEYSNLIQVEEADFVDDIQTVDIETLPLVDKAYGYKLGQLKLGEYPGIGSQFEAGAYSDIIYQGQQYLVAPLEYRDVFKWLNNNKVGTPGYILINKVTTETKFVNLTELSGEGLLYTPSAYFNQDLVRHAYYNGLAKYRLENQFFEIDESGNPYYVLQYSLPTIFINGGNKINKIAVVNAISGAIDIYNPGEEPDWVESVYPNSLLFEQLNYWGSLQDGWLNSVFAQRGVLQTSTGTRVVMNEGELYYFTGLTSAGNDESTIGFVYTGMKTKETRLFRFPGATEDAAMNKVLTLLPQNNISTSFPIPINVQDVPTYFIVIKGEDGRILRYAFISVQDLELYSISENSKTEAYNSYLVQLSEVNTGVSDEVSGVITEIDSYVVGGNTVYWVEIDDQERYKINVSNFSDSEMGYFTSLSIGDTITMNVLGYNVLTIQVE